MICFLILLFCEFYFASIINNPELIGPRERHRVTKLTKDLHGNSDNLLICNDYYKCKEDKKLVPIDQFSFTSVGKSIWKPKYNKSLRTNSVREKESNWLVLNASMSKACISSIGALW